MSLMSPGKDWLHDLGKAKTWTLVKNSEFHDYENRVGPYGICGASLLGKGGAPQGELQTGQADTQAQTVAVGWPAGR